MAAENISDDDLVSRLLFEPSMRKEEKDLVWDNIFQFPSDQGQCESVLWRAKAPTIDEVHSSGCAKQASDRAKGKDRSTYFGSITGKVSDIRSLKSATGACLTVEHAPDEGKSHAHIGFSPGTKKNDRSELKVMLRSAFGALEPHTCP
ncbi:hypothetical protein EI171_26075 [Bradyrhizobium sp. LCT2]|uniref:hypothetical protein n=1 Tax=Bradyrhizobium sp. LCT2 TaxID=2493093 RepID=UPI0013744A2D|nr:hypothetical protein [Bradyrhizobium sp. LCT2]QHP70452.1 hypothetical protein EI171_26075 [Bradyrhizobium sp. LCT2]